MIYLAADIHGYIRLNWLKAEMTKLHVTTLDYLIILGDAGIVWSETEYLEVMEYYNNLPCRVLFIDGNHENFDLLEKYPVEQKYGGNVHVVSHNISHLMRGEVFELCGKKVFVFGGGFSAKKITHSSPVYVWDREMPNDEEYGRGVKNLKRNNNMVDYVFTHVAPTNIANKIGVQPLLEEKVLNDYLQSISNNLRCNGWYFGHYHKDVTAGAFHGIYNTIVCLEEN